VAITFSGEFTSPRSADEVYDFLCDPKKFGPLLPDFESMSVQDATHFTLKVRVGVGNVRGTAEIKMELAESIRPTRAQYIRAGQRRRQPDHRRRRLRSLSPSRGHQDRVARRGQRIRQAGFHGGRHA